MGEEFERILVGWFGLRFPCVVAVEVPAGAQAREGLTGARGTTCMAVRGGLGFSPHGFLEGCLSVSQSQEKATVLFMTQSQESHTIISVNLFVRSESLGHSREEN